MTISTKTKKRIVELFEKNDYKELFVNKKGELFTSENLARLSVKSEKDYQKVTKSEAMGWEVSKNKGKSSGSNSGGNNNPSGNNSENQAGTGSSNTGK